MVGRGWYGPEPWYSGVMGGGVGTRRDAQRGRRVELGWVRVAGFGVRVADLCDRIGGDLSDLRLGSWGS